MKDKYILLKKEVPSLKTSQELSDTHVKVGFPKKLHFQGQNEATMARWFQGKNTTWKLAILTDLLVTILGMTVLMKS